MKRIKDLKIGLRLNIILSTLFVILVGLMGVYVVSVQKKSLLKNNDIRMNEQVKDLAQMVEIELKLSQERVNNILNLSSAWLYSNGNFSINTENSIFVEAKNQISHASSHVEINDFQYNGKSLYKSVEIVDKIMELSGATSTIFQKIPGGFLRISTNVKNSNGDRAVGTYIPNESPVIQAIKKGLTFKGRAYVVNDWYMTAYEPIVVDGDVVGIFYVGIPEKNLEDIRKVFAEKKYLETGYPFLIDKYGTMIIHPTREGEDMTGEVFYQQLAEAKTSFGKTNYPWDGRMKFQYFQYIEEIETFVSASIYEDELYGMVRAFIKLLIIAVVISLGIFITANYFNSKSISDGLAQSVQFANRLAEGDLTAKLSIDQKDEVGILATALSNMGRRLRETVMEVVNGANNISSASNEMSSTSQELSQGASEQASSAEEVSSSMEEMAANIQQNTDSAQQAEQIVIKATSGIKEGSEATTIAVTSMKNIADKIKIINDIAFQTNILALNAAVEAARAGEHGKGFAVVAAEVRKLAERSKIAADEIDDLSSDGVRVAELAGNKLVEIVPEIEKTAKLVQEIAAASIEQNSGANQVNNAIQQLNQVTQQNAAASEEMATSSEELSSQAEQLKELMSYFKTDEFNSRQKAVTQRSVKKPEAEVIKEKKAAPVKKNESVSAKKTVRNETQTKAEDKTTPQEKKGVVINMGKDSIDDGYERF